MKGEIFHIVPDYSNIHSGSFIPKFGRRDRIYEGRDGGMEKGEGNNFAWKCIGNRIQLPPPPPPSRAKWNAQPMLTYLHGGWPTCRERNWLVARNEAG